MSEPEDFFKLERLAGQAVSRNRPAVFLDKIREIYESSGLEHAIKALKKSGICVDPYGSNRFGRLYAESVRLLNDMTGGNGQIDRLVMEADLLDRLFRDFEQLRKKEGVEDIRDKRKVPAFLIGLEVSLGGGREYLHNQFVSKIKQRYPFVWGVADDAGPMMRLRNGHEFYWSILDTISENSGLVLNYFLHNETPFTGLHTSIGINEIQIIRSHMPLTDRYDRLMSTLDCWKFVESEVRLQEDGVISIEPLDREKYLRIKRANYRTRAMRKIWQLQFRRDAQHLNYDSETLLLPPEHVRSKHEKLACIYCHEFFGSDLFDEECLDIPLSHWLRAYQMLGEEGNRVLQERNTVRSLTLNQWAIVKTKEEWAALISSGGVPEENATVIVDNLTFIRGSKDPLDCPLIPIDGYLLALPSILSIVEPAIAMLSNFTSKGIDIGFKGTGFERRVREKVKSSGFPCSELHYRGDEGEFECDAAFVIDDDLYFVECKSQGYPQSYREHETFERNVHEDSLQLNRIYNFYSRRMDLVRQRLELPGDWTPRNMHQMVLYQSTHGRTDKVNGCWIIDKSVFWKFFDREPVGFVSNDHMIAYNQDEIVGDITSEKFLRYIADPPQIKSYMDFSREVARVMPVHNEKLRFVDYNAPPIFFADAKTRAAFEKMVAKLENVE